MQTFLDLLDTVLNSALGFALIWAAAFGLVMLFLHRISPFHKPWEDYEGAIITAIKLAEKSISNDTPNAGLRRLDEALQFVLKTYADQHAGKAPSPQLVRQLREGIQIKHAELERLGNLRAS